MTIISSTFPLIDGPLSAPHESREDLVRRMAERLVTYDAYRNEGDAIRCLMMKGFSPFEVMRFVDDARQVATQSVVAKEMMDRPSPAPASNSNSTAKFVPSTSGT